MTTRPGDASTDRSAALLRARNAVAVVFALNGLLFASLVSRIPDLRGRLGLDNGQLGLLLLTIAVGSLVALPLTGRLVARFGARAVVRSGAAAATAGLLVAGVSTGAGLVVPCAVGLAAYGGGVGLWDVAMNVEAAEVERALDRPVMPRFHAGFSFGSVLGAGLGAGVVALDLPLLGHLAVVALAATAVVLRVTRDFRPDHAADAGSGGSGGSAGAPGEVAPPVVDGRSAWTEPRTLALGLMVLAFAVAEGTANDWLSLALIDGYDAPRWLGVAGFSLFVVAMTAGRLVGPVVLTRWGRPGTLWCSCGLAALGILVVVHGGTPVFVAAGIVVWGLGASLGFPVGMSAAADDPVRAAARVSVVSTVGYGAFLAGPPLLGRLGDVVGTLPSLQVVALLMAPAAIAVLATRVPATSPEGADGC